MITKIQIPPEIMQNSVGLEEMLKSKEGVITSIIMTDSELLEEYKCMDEYGNTLATMILSDHIFTVICSDYASTDFIPYENDHIKGSEKFYDDERVEQLSIAIDRINEWYDGGKLIQCIPDTPESDSYDPKNIYRLRMNLTDRDIWHKLYLYEKSNLLPEDVMDIRKKGPIVGYRECCLKIIKLHRQMRCKYIPGADTSGLTPEQLEQELNWLKNINMQWPNCIMARVSIVNWLFEKQFDDFEEVFIEYSKIPTTDLPKE